MIRFHNGGRNGRNMGIVLGRYFVCRGSSSNGLDAPVDLGAFEERAGVAAHIAGG
jgi:hypothetical protein